MHESSLGRTGRTRHARMLICVAAATGALANSQTTNAEVLSVIGGTLRVEDPGNGGQANVAAKFLSASSGLTNELFLDAPTFLGPIFNSKTTPANATAQLGSFLPETVLFIRNQSFLPSTTGGPASLNFGWFTGDGTLPLNPDRLPHAIFTWDTNNPGVVTVGFEDLFGGGDFDFNDAVYQFTNVHVGVVTVALSPINLTAGSEVTVNAEDTRSFANLNGNFTNAGTVNNNGSIINYGEAFNTGELNNLANYFNDRLGTLSITGTVTSSGTFQSAGFIGIGSTGIFKNEGVAKVLGAVLSNSGEWLNAAQAQFENAASSQFQNNSVAENLGDFVNSGALDNLHTVNNSGNLTNGSTGSFGNALGALLTNNGTVTNFGQMLSSGITENANQFLNAATGFFENAGLLNNLSELGNQGTVQNLNEFINSGGMENLGTWINAQGSTTTNNALISNGGNLTIEEGASISGTGTYEQNDGSTVLNGTMSQFVDLKGGVFKGSGTVNGNLTNSTGGTLSPGNSPGTLSVTGDVSLEGGTLEIEIEESEHDVLAVSGSFTVINGTVTYIFGFTPEYGDTFNFLTAAGGITGLDQLTITSNLPGYLDVETYLVAADTLTVEVVPEPNGLLVVAAVGLTCRRRRREPVSLPDRR